jgi:hypothetical protein
MSIKVFYRKLGRERAYGFAHHGDDVIEIDERLQGKQFIEILIHEIMHLQNPEWSEEEVLRKSKEMCAIIWKEGVRPVESSTKYI